MSELELRDRTIRLGTRATAPATPADIDDWLIWRRASDGTLRYVTGAGVDTPFAVPPSGAAGGSLAGTFPNPTIAAGAVGSAEINSAIKDAAAGTASLRTLGTGSTQAAAGNDSRLSDARTPTGAAGGSLSGSYPNPGIAAGAVGGTEIASGIKDAAAGTASLRTLGTGAAQACAGNDSRLSDARTPTGAAGGSLSGTFPNPGIAAGAIGSTEVAAAIKDAAAATASLRTLGTGAAQACAGNDSRLSDARTPTGTAGGMLSGTYPNPSIPNATSSTAGAMAAADKAKVDNLVYDRMTIPVVATDDPNNSNWAVNAIAAFQADSLNAGSSVAGYDDTIEQGRGISMFVPPAGCTQVRLTTYARAQTAPGAARTAALKIYKRLRAASAGTSAVSTWDSITLADFSFPTNTNGQTFVRTFNLTDFTTAMVVGNQYQLELTRVAPAAGTKLVGNMVVDGWIVEFI